MRTDQDTIVRRSDYQAPAWWVEKIELSFELDPLATRVRSKLQLRRNPDSNGPTLFNGEDIELVDIRVDGEQLPPSQFLVDGHGLRIDSLPTHCELEIETLCVPAHNTSLNGLYVSNGNFFTQCEAEGFRRITYFPDRPDVMACFDVRISAPTSEYPTLLSNGNLVAQGAEPDRAGWHWAKWQDPFPKPCYLFALVAGRFDCAEQRIRTGSGREVLLQIHVEPGRLDQTAHAMASLIHSIRWDEQRFGLEIDLDRFMIVAVSDFNMGAMENKGLNIFNTRFVFASPRLATDADFAHVESVVGHEYFHNWTGNRVTCRDWFQLTLKEGLTVFRDQEFSADRLAEQAGSDAAARSARAVKRIEDVRFLRTAQFAEDAGPMAHPIRPDAYQEINNFYTLTVYEKGAEVIRMLHTLVGEAGFRQGMDRYFELFDGQAVTCDDFVDAIAQANTRDFSQFRRWYQQAGTPRLHVSRTYDEQSGSLHIDFRQTPGRDADGSTGEPLHMPVAIGLVLPDGTNMPVPAPVPADAENKGSVCAGSTRILELTQRCQRFSFTGITAVPTLSIARGFSAPIIIDHDYSVDELSLLACHDEDPFNRWDAIGRLALKAIVAGLGSNEPNPYLDSLDAAFERVLDDDRLDPAFKHLALSLPAENFVIEQLDAVDPTRVRAAIEVVRCHLAHSLESRWHAAASVTKPPYRADPAAAGQRALCNTALAYWVAGATEAAIDAVWTRFREADNMTDQAASLHTLINSNAPMREQALAQFESEFRDEPLVMDKWFALQASRHRQAGEPPVLACVRKLLEHPAYSIRNPNKIRALVGVFCTNNPAEFHAADGSGYAFWAEQVALIDAINPQIAARLGRAMDRWTKFEPGRQQAMLATLSQLKQTPNLSNDLSEIIGKALADADPQSTES